MPLILRPLEDRDEAAFMEGLTAFAGEDPHWYSFLWREGMTFAEMIAILRAEEAGDVPADRVPHTMLYGFVDGRIVGRVSVRHELNEMLRRRGGHIGYAVAPAYRRLGHATEMVRQALDYCRGLGLSRILVTCGDDNLPSARIIEAFGGRLEGRVIDEVDGELIRRYWIDLSAG